MEKDEFREQMLQILGRFNESYLLSAEKPVGVLLMITDGYRYEPHVEWFAWATPRERMETSAKFLNVMRSDGLLGVMYMAEADSKFLEHLARRGIVRRVGKVLDFFGLHRNANFYQTSKRDII